MRLKTDRLIPLGSNYTRLALLIGGCALLTSSVLACSDPMPAEPTCGDGLHNGDETDIDCGGACAACATGAMCELPEDCQSQQCESGACVQAAVCGDGVVDAGEACDDGAESAACNSDCTVAACGDGTLNASAGEACDDAGESAACNSDCTAAECGDGTLNAAAGEQCDDGGESTACDVDCTIPECGDGTVNASVGETCDDGNNQSGDLCGATCLAEPCFEMTNTPAEDMLDRNWFDACVDAPGHTINIRVRDAALGTVVYDASGPIIGAWTYDFLTSTHPNFGQHNDVENHDRLIPLDNGDHLQISGRFGGSMGCFGALGNGYGITIYGPELPDPGHTGIKLGLFPYRNLGANPIPRRFEGWEPGDELSWIDGALMDSCVLPGLVGFAGSIQITVSH